ncbi:AAA family ATPase [Nocardia sp. NPDC004123]
MGAKLADLYEGYWTVHSGVIPVLDGRFSTLRLEPPGEDKIEFKLTGHLGEPSEGHQCKRSHGTTWTLNALRKVGFLAGLERLAVADIRPIFASEQMSIFGELTRKVKRVSDDEVRADLNEDEEAAFDELMGEWKLGEEALAQRLRAMTFHVIGPETLERVTLEKLSLVVEGDPENVFATLWHWLKKTAPQVLDSEQLWAFLKETGYGPRGGHRTDLAGRLSTLVKAYTRDMVSERPSLLAEIPRHQVGQIIEMLTGAERPATVMLTGAPGSGKSYVLGQVIAELQARGVVVGVMRLDIADRAKTADALGRQDSIGFGGSPVAVLSRAKANRPGVLVVDQVDAMSRLSGRGGSIGSAVQQMLQDLRASDDLSLLMACRSEDLRFDSTLRRLVGMDGSGGIDEPRKIELTDLTEQEVGTALARVGLDGALPLPGLVQLLRNPLNLSLFVEVFEDSSGDERASLLATRSRIALLARFHAHKADKSRDVLGHNGYRQITLSIAARMSDDAVLSLPTSRFASVADSLEYLHHHGVLVGDESRIRFFHEAYYEYLAALAVLEKGRTATDVLGQERQLLSRRGLIRSILTLEREQIPEYHADLAGVLSRGVRSHIRAAVFSQLASQHRVDLGEAAVVLSVAVDSTDPMRRVAVGTLSSKPFVNTFVDEDLLRRFVETYCGIMPPAAAGCLSGTIQGLAPSELLYLLFESARYRPNEAAKAALPITRMSDRVPEWFFSITRLIELAGTASGADVGPELLRLYQGALAAACDVVPEQSLPDDGPGAEWGEAARGLLPPVASSVFHDGGMHIVDVFIDRFAAVGADAVRAWLEACRRICDRVGYQKSLFGENGLLTAFRNGPALGQCANHDPVRFVHQLAEVMVEDYRRSSAEMRWTPTGSDLDRQQCLRWDMTGFGIYRDTLGPQMSDAFVAAVAAAAAQEWRGLPAILRRIGRSDTVAAHQVLAAAYSRGGQALIEDAARWIEDPRVRGLAEGGTHGWAWGAVVARVASVGTHEQRERALTLVEAAYPPILEKESTTPDPQIVAEEHVVVSLLSRSLGVELPERFRQRLLQLDAAHGVVAEEPEPWSRVIFTPRNDDPDSSGLDDAQWLDLVAELAAIDPEAARAKSIRRGLRTDAQQEPARFARLLTTFPTHTPVAALTAVLSGIAASLETRAHLDAHGQLADSTDVYRAILQAMSRSQDQDLDREIARCIHHSANDPHLPDEIVAILVRLCDRDRNSPESHHTGSLLSNAWNLPRGVAFNAVAALLVPLSTRSVRFSLVRSTVISATTDPAEYVRVLVPQALLRAWSENPHLVGELAGRWFEATSDEGLDAPDVFRLMWIVRHEHPALIADFLRALMTSPRDEARVLAGRVATLCAVHHVDLPGFEESVLAGFMSDTRARVGVADFLTQLVSSLPVVDDADVGEFAPTQALLVRLMNDESDMVREQTTWVVRYMDGPLDSYAGLFEKIGATRMFAETPAMVLSVLSRRLGELPESVLGLCERWLDLWSGEAGDLSTHASAEAFEVTDLVLAIYGGAQPVAVIDRCLAVIDRLIEHGAMNVNLKVDQATFDPNQSGR